MVRGEFNEDASWEYRDSPTWWHDVLLKHVSLPSVLSLPVVLHPSGLHVAPNMADPATGRPEWSFWPAAFIWSGV